MIEQPIATKKRTREIQEKYQAQTKKSFGQNFIVEPGVVDKIAKAACGNEGASVIEIGPGIGALTQYLCEYAPEVVAYEIDPRFPPILEKEIDSDHLKVILQDFLETDVDKVLEDFEKQNKKVRFAGNLPYYITTPILFKLFEATHPVDAITVMMQKEVADRFAARPSSKEYNALSVITQYRTDIKKIMDVNRNVFWPSPNVGSSVLQFTFKNDHPIPVEQEKEFFELVKACFTQRRKTIYNNLQEYMKDNEAASAILEKAGIPLNTRAQQLELSDFIRLFEVMKDED
ncbi:16S rRNA (adenine(1518)-N(6)/adenine(1519)-N(6))-dimethyltransferase RsmA [Ileibacterium valens]|uniref:16S rRNA (adenine(1518)-N(6)/adenine(1519)-N(6))- dimethyltransferase RsmA n=1 Tax=Ileibacterium valens TaxID=1862668 RepID=UPI003F74162F